MDQAYGTLVDDPRLRGPMDVDTYYRLAREGLIPSPKRVELIEGELHRMNSIGSPHASTVMRLTRLFLLALQDRGTVSVQNPLRLDRQNEPEPDVMLLAPRADFYRGAHPSAGNVLLLIEVADNSLALDRGRKRALYARFGVREYWVVDVEGDTVDVCRGPGPRDYASVREERPGTVLDVEALPGITVAEDDIVG